MDGRKKSTITCVPCHKAKRGCVGPFPCQRCVAGHKEADCIVYEARKRGPLPRKRRASDARSDFADRALVGKDAIVADLLVSYASAALSERPGDIASLFGLSFPFGFLLAECSTPLHRSRIVGYGNPPDDHDLLPHMGAPHTFLHMEFWQVGAARGVQGQGRPSMDLMLQAAGPGTGTPWIRSFRIPLNFRSMVGGSMMQFVVDVYILMKDGVPRWIFTSPGLRSMDAPPPPQLGVAEPEPPPPQVLGVAGPEPVIGTFPFIEDVDNLPELDLGGPFE